MPFYKGNLLNHFRKVESVLAKMGGEALLDARSFVLELRVGGRQRLLYPQFAVLKNGVRRRTCEFDAAATQFLGWRPSRSRRWELASDKLEFKRFAVQNGLRTPEYSTDPREAPACVVVKRSASPSVVKGPFKHASEHRLDASRGEYFERFVAGMMTTVWYWAGAPVCLEFEKMPMVKGDGVCTIGQLIERRLFGRGRKAKVGTLVPFLRYQGVTLDCVLAKGQEQLVDYRYGSALLVGDFVRNVDLATHPLPALAAQFRDIGAKLWRAIPQDARADEVFSVQAVVDGQEQVWALGVSADPFIHPYVYPVMLESLFGSEHERAAPIALTA